MRKPKMKNPRTYIMISLLKGDVNKVFYYFLDKLPSIKFAGVKDNDLFIAVPDGCQGISLKQLKQTIAEVSMAEVNMGDIYEDGEVIMYDLTY